MFFFKYIRILFQRLKYLLFGKPRWQKEVEHPIEFAFSFEGEEYFAYTNSFNLPYQRGLVAVSYYEELQMRITREFMEAWVVSIKSEMEKPAVRVMELCRLIQMIEDRLEWVVAPETIYKLASVVFFTKTESPYKYDPIFNARKITKWKKANHLDFFFQLPLKDLIPFLSQSPDAIQSYLRAVTAKEMEQISILLAGLSLDKSYDEQRKVINFQMEALQELYSAASL